MKNNSNSPKFYSMRFHTFWSTVAMILGAISGVAAIGNAYSELETISSGFEWLVYVDMTFGAIHIIACIRAFAGRKNKTPEEWWALLAPLAIMSANRIYVLAISVYLGVEQTTAIGGLIGVLVVSGLIANYYYKRKFLFCESESNRL